MSDDTGREFIADLCRIPNPRGIDRAEYVTLGGIDQFVSIRGQNADNPVLVVCHGGPALPALPSSWIWQRGVEEYFTVVNYDQRASGKSVPYTDEDADLDLDRYVNDLAELIAWLQTELGVSTVGLLGHSWGSIIGVTLAQRRPELLWAYVGVGQVVSGIENEAEAFEHAVRSATLDGNSAALAELAELGEYPGTEPLTLERIVVCRRWAQHYGGLSAYRSSSDFLFGAEDLSPYYADDERDHIGRGQAMTMPKILPQLLRFDAREETAFAIPVVQVLGRHDWTTPTAPVERWFDRVSAPSKHSVWFENSAHLCMLEKPGRFLMSLADVVLPLAQESRSALQSFTARS